LIGAAEDSLAVTPWNDDAEVWACSTLLRGKLPRWDRWFEIHGFDEDGQRAGDKDYGPWLQRSEGIVYVKDSNDQQWVPRAVIYPKDLVLDHLPAVFLTSSIAWMFALAMYLKASEIGLYGINAAGTEEYNQQHASLCWLIGIAQERGIKITIPPESDVMKTAYLYGFERSVSLNRKFRTRHREATQVVATHQRLAAEALRQQHQHEGQVKEIEYILRNWT